MDRRCSACSGTHTWHALWGSTATCGDVCEHGQVLFFTFLREVLHRDRKGAAGHGQNWDVAAHCFIWRRHVGTVAAKVTGGAWVQKKGCV